MQQKDTTYTMRKLLVAIVLFLILSHISQAQEPDYKVYLPIIMLKDIPKNNWQIIDPVQSTNFVLNPSAEGSGNFAAVGSATITQSNNYQKYGLLSYLVQTIATNTGLSLTLSTLTNSPHWMTARIRGRLPRELKFSIGSSSKKAVFIEKIDDYWDLYGVQFGASESNGRTSARITQFGAGSAEFYVDGVQVEPLADWTTYIDGTQEGCEWNGIAHASSSFRSGESLAGGTPHDLYQQYRFFVERIVGAGASTQSLNVDSYALLPGGELNSIKVEPRQFTLIGKFITETETELHDARQELIKTLKRTTPGQPLMLRFNGGTVQKEIGVYYQGGLEGDLGAFYENYEPMGDNQWGEVKTYTEKASIQFQAPDPYWYEVGESAVNLETNDSATFRLVAARLRNTGQWSNLGPPAVGGTYTQVFAIVEDATYIYIGGDFANFNNIANADNIVRYNKSTGAYSALDVGLNSIVYALALGPNGDLYIGGTFSNAGGVAAADFITRWDGTAFNAVGTPVTGAAAILDVRALIFDHSGNLYVGGDFANWNNIAAADRIVMWNGAAYSALAAGLPTGAVTCFAIGLDNTLFLGGTFTNAGGDANADWLAQWNGTAFSSVIAGFGSGSGVESLAVDPGNGTLYFGGPFQDAGGVTGLSFIGSWNGTSPSALGSGISNAAYALIVDKNGLLYLGGNFTSAGGIALSDRMARWNGYTFSHLDIDLPGSATVWDFYISKFADPVIKQKYDLYVGFDTTGTGNYAGKLTVANEGSVPAFPKIVFGRSGGVAAIVETLKNERTGKELLFNYSLLSGETLTIDLTPTNKSIVSSFFSSRLDAVLPNSDFGTWQLLPGDNDITSFIAVSGSPDIVAYLLWRDVYDSWD